ncbi:MAG: ABC transporter permease, partial [Algicola sp.]|nr:ABC transporter permease [Algicola sp.]
MKLNGFTTFSVEVILDIINFRKSRSINIDVLVKQVLFTGVEAIGLCVMISLMLGALIIVEGYQLLAALGQIDWIYKILIFAMVRDLGPFIICFIVLARSGTAITTELGNMVISKEVDALIVMGISPISYLV